MCFAPVRVRPWMPREISAGRVFVSWLCAWLLHGCPSKSVGHVAGHCRARMACSLAWAEQRLREGALEAAAKCVATLPPTAQALYLQGGVLTLSGDGVRAVPFFERATALNPAHADAYFELGNALLSQRENSRAEKAYLAALRSEPARAVCYLNLGNLYTDQRRVSKADPGKRS